MYIVPGTNNTLRASTVAQTIKNEQRPQHKTETVLFNYSQGDKFAIQYNTGSIIVHISNISTIKSKIVIGYVFLLFMPRS